MKPRVRLVVFLLLAVATSYVAYHFLQGDGIEAAQTWRNHAWIIALAIVINFAGIALDSVCWLWTYRRCGIGIRGILGAGVYLSVFAAQLLPAQTGRLFRPDAVQRLGWGRFRHAVEAEVSLVYLDLTAVIALTLTLVLWYVHPLIGLAVGAGAGLFALRMAALVSPYLPDRAQVFRPDLFWSLPGLACLALRIMDRSLLGLVLLVLLIPVDGYIAYPRVALFALMGDTIGAVSGIPGGLGVAEPTIGWLLSLTDLPAAHIVLAVAMFRLITFWSMVPIGWVALLLVQRSAARVSNLPTHDAYNAGLNTMDKAEE